jgi:hypothetical protein
MVWIWYFKNANKMLLMKLIGWLFNHSGSTLIDIKIWFFPLLLIVCYVMLSHIYSSANEKYIISKKKWISESVNLFNSLSSSKRRFSLFISHHCRSHLKGLLFSSWCDRTRRSSAFHPHLCQLTRAFPLIISQVFFLLLRWQFFSSS